MTRPDALTRFIDALRSAANADEPGLRESAFEALAAARDPEAQQQLVDGLETPGRALVPAALALRLLSQDPHAPARDAALSYADDTSDPAARLEALRVLASDPRSVDRFVQLLSEPLESEEVRILAATALSSQTTE